jgi:hypothetical protein
MPEKRSDTTRRRRSSDAGSPAATPAEPDPTPAEPDPAPAEPDPALIAEGARLVEVLDEEGAGPAVAFWIWFRDVRGFRLILSGGALGAAAPEEADRRVREILARDRSFDALVDRLVGVKRPEARVVVAVRDAVSTGPGLHGIRIRDNVVGGIRLQRAYIYRSS